jgi:hypothetical protein
MPPHTPHPFATWPPPPPPWQETELAELEEELKLAAKGKAKEGKKVQAPEAVKARITKKKAQISTFKIRAQVGLECWGSWVLGPCMKVLGPGWGVPGCAGTEELARLYLCSVPGLSWTPAAAPLPSPLSQHLASFLHWLLLRRTLGPSLHLPPSVSATQDK